MVKYYLTITSLLLSFASFGQPSEFAFVTLEQRAGCDVNCKQMRAKVNGELAPLFAQNVIPSSGWGGTDQEKIKILNDTFRDVQFVFTGEIGKGYGGQIEATIKFFEVSEDNTLNDITNILPSVFKENNKWSNGQENHKNWTDEIKKDINRFIETKKFRNHIIIEAPNLDPSLKDSPKLIITEIYKNLHERLNKSNDINKVAHFRLIKNDNPHTLMSTFKQHNATIRVKPIISNESGDTFSITNQLSIDSDDVQTSLVSQLRSKILDIISKPGFK
ncbi:MAG: hypothetical protein ACK47E_09150 [Cyclobacteriaceae bacterium]